MTKHSTYISIPGIYTYTTDQDKMLWRLYSWSNIPRIFLFLIYTHIRPIKIRCYEGYTPVNGTWSESSQFHFYLVLEADSHFLFICYWFNIDKSVFVLNYLHLYGAWLRISQLRRRQLVHSLSDPSLSGPFSLCNNLEMLFQSCLLMILININTARQCPYNPILLTVIHWRELATPTYHGQCRPWSASRPAYQELVFWYTVRKWHVRTRRFIMQM